MTALAAAFPTSCSSSSSASAPSAQRTIAAPTPEEKSRRRWALIRHYNVLFCSFPSHFATSSSSSSSSPSSSPPSSPYASSSSPSTSSLSLANRTWHDGVLTQHTFNGKLILFDSAESSRTQDDGSSGTGGVEVADCFASPAEVGREMLHEGREVQVGEWRVSIGEFLRVGRVDLDSVLGHGQGNKVKGQDGRKCPRQGDDGKGRRAMGPQNAAAVGRSGLSSPSAGKTTTPHRPNGPQSPHPFKTPFKRKAQTDDEDGQEVRKQVASTPPSSSSVPSPIQRNRLPNMTPTAARSAVPHRNDSIRRRRLGSRSSLSAARSLDATPPSTVDRHSNSASERE